MPPSRARLLVLLGGLTLAACRSNSLPANADASTDGQAVEVAGSPPDSVADSAPDAARSSEGGDGRRQVSSWLDRCYIAANLGPGPGFTEAPECVHGLCLRFPDPETGCLRQGCTASCVRDEDCPEGAFCDPSKALAPWLNSYPVCRPGQRGAPPAHSCADAGG